MPRDPRMWDLTPGASKLHERRDEVVGLFRDGLALRKIGAKVGMSASGVRRWLMEQGEYDRRVMCELPECRKTFPFRPRKRYCCYAHVKRATARRCSAKPENKAKNRARNALRKAVYEGRVARPSSCERCGDAPGFGADGRSLVQADHHHGYDDEHALDVWWICVRCDAEVEKLRRAGAAVTRESPHKDVH